jgi:type II secretory pathway component PulF
VTSWPKIETEWLVSVLFAGKEEGALARLLNENEETMRQRDGLKKRLELMERAAQEIMNFRV